jgi:hypothetical protein
MQKVVFEMDDNDARKWKEASPSKRRKVIAFISKLLNLDNQSLLEEPKVEYARSEEQQNRSPKAVSSLLNEDLYPTGADQIELAIELAEAGVSAETISKLTRLSPELFEAFIKK